MHSDIDDKILDTLVDATLTIVDPVTTAIAVDRCLVANTDDLSELVDEIGNKKYAVVWTLQEDRKDGQAVNNLRAVQSKMSLIAIVMANIPNKAGVSRKRCLRIAHLLKDKFINYSISEVVMDDTSVVNPHFSQMDWVATTPREIRTGTPQINEPAGYMVAVEFTAKTKKQF